ncbi:hypothetical protein PROFUN_07073 [Planoprotostelium fungivorum]|uniref:Uncharacterized protein n=1 Tax=Planoprotostelium fungivorum TaxID=1890364 RepID=A0A2P6NN38_9EUKA|nr:hypothetical protein PROFUN_07073 [Planoprotostelium fungivorum]
MVRIFGAPFSAQEDTTTLVILNIIHKCDDPNEELLAMGIRLSSTELQTIENKYGGGGERRFAKQILRYEYRLVRNFYHSLSGHEWTLAWGLSRKMPGNWVNAFLRLVEGRVEYLFFRAGLLRSQYTGRSMLRSGLISCYRGAEQLSSSAPKSRMILRPGDVAHLSFKSRKEMFTARLNAMFFRELWIRYPPPYLLIDYEGLSLAFADDIHIEDIRYPFLLPGDDYTKRLKAAFDGAYYYSKKRFRHKHYEDMFAKPARLVDADTNIYAKISNAPHFETTIPSIFVVGKRNPVKSRTYTLPFHSFPQDQIDRITQVQYPNIRGRVRTPAPLNPLDMIKDGLKTKKITEGPRLFYNAKRALISMVRR